MKVITIDERAIMDLLGGGQCVIDDITIKVKSTRSRTKLINAMKVLRTILRIRAIELSDNKIRL